ncbi:hypothetical protein BCR34DRAFT_308625 [Clohesyomyces aquaticus]|uniref:Uncharacterized protein n=1 Tax=Clohesyomyces aquaticus TaxID=1231657 RepID=A0A1Y1ZQ49_9PLEO|nr:hypothetical protein BCR34DRAFT_308625 [Clohesyomyces aquaticus]
MCVGLLIARSICDAGPGTVIYGGAGWMDRRMHLGGFASHFEDLQVSFLKPGPLASLQPTSLAATGNSKAHQSPAGNATHAVASCGDIHQAGISVFLSLSLAPLQTAGRQVATSLSRCNPHVSRPSTHPFSENSESQSTWQPRGYVDPRRRVSKSGSEILFRLQVLLLGCKARGKGSYWCRVPFVLQLLASYWRPGETDQKCANIMSRRSMITMSLSALDHKWQVQGQEYWV